MPDKFDFVDDPTDEDLDIDVDVEEELPDIFQGNALIDDFDIRIGDSLSHEFEIENAKEVVFNSPMLSYQVPLYYNENSNTWVLSLTSYQTQVIEHGSYRYELKIKNEDETIETYHGGIIRAIPYIFPLYKTYPIVMKDIDPTPADSQYGVPTLWYNRVLKKVWFLEYNKTGEAMWEPWNSSNGVGFLYQSDLTEEFKLRGDTTEFSFIKVFDNKYLSFIEGTYIKDRDMTVYNLDLNNSYKSDYILYVDKDIEYKEELGTYEEEIEESKIIYKFSYDRVSTKYIDEINEKLPYKADLIEGKVPSDQLPSYVDDVIEFDKFVQGTSWLENILESEIGSLIWNNTGSSNLVGGTSNPYYKVFVKNIDGTVENLKIVSPEFGKIYVNKSNSNTYRWSGTNLVEISKSIGLGESSSTAYPGDKGKANAEAISNLKIELNSDQEINGVKTFNENILRGKGTGRYLEIGELHNPWDKAHITYLYAPYSAVNFAPQYDDSKSLGIPERRWKYLYLNNKIFIGNNYINVDDSGRINISYSDEPRIKIGSAETLFVSRVTPDRNDTYDLGRSGLRWKDLYLSGKLYLGEDYIYNNGDYSFTFNIHGIDRFQIFQNSLKPVTDMSFHFGSKTQRLGDIYLGGVLTDGTNSIKVEEIANKSAFNNYYTNTETDEILNNYYTKEESYNKEELDLLFDGKVGVVAEKIKTTVEKAILVDTEDVITGKKEFKVGNTEEANIIVDKDKTILEKPTIFNGISKINYTISKDTEETSIVHKKYVDTKYLEILQIAEGKTKTYVVSYENNPSLNTQDDSVILTSDLTTIGNENIYLSNLKIGDIILVKETEVPDRYVGITGDTLTLYKLETQKIDLSEHALIKDIPTKLSELQNDSKFAYTYDITNALDNFKADEFEPKIEEIEKSIKRLTDNSVDLTSNQTISGIKTFSLGPILQNEKYLKVQNNSGIVYQILGADAANKIMFGHSGMGNISVLNTFRPDGTVAGTVDLGTPNQKWRNLYLIGELNLTNSEATNASWSISQDKYAQLNVNRTYNGTFETMFSFNGRNFLPYSNNTGDLGSINKQWKDLYLSGKLSDGTNEITIAKIVDTESDQIISGVKTFTNGIKLGDDNYSIKKRSNGSVIDIYVNDTVNPTVVLGRSSSSFASTIRSNSNKTHSLGTAENQWKDLYLSGVLSDGDNSITIAQIVNMLSTLTREQLVSTIGEATASLSGLMSAEDKTNLNTLVALLQEDDNDVVDKINEVLAIFNQYPEGADLVSALLLKADKDKVVDLTSDQTISGNKTFGTIKIKHPDKTNFFQISPDSNGYNVKFSFGNNVLMMLHNGGITNYRDILPDTNGTRNLGSTSTLFKNLYISGYLSDGTNSIKVEEIAKKSDLPTDYVDLSSDQEIEGTKSFVQRPLIKVLGTKLPEEYQEVEYIESTGTQYIDTTVVTDNNSKIVIQAQATGTIGMGYRLFGSRTGAKVGNFISTNNDKVYVDYGGSSFEASFSLDNNIHTYNLDKNKFYYDGVLLKEWSVVEFNAPSHAYLFGAYHDGGIVVKPWKIWYCRLYDNGILVRNLIPCYRKSDNVIGMYDTVSGSFYINQGTGEFLKGNDVLTSSEEKYVSVATLSDVPNSYTKEESDSKYIPYAGDDTLKGGLTIGKGGLTLGAYNGNGLLFPSSVISEGVQSSIGIHNPIDGNYCTLVGFINGIFTIGHSSFNTNIRGANIRPTYNGNELALKSDLDTIDVSKEQLVSTIGEATASLSGLMSAEDKTNLNTLVALLQEDDNDVVDKINEVLAIFNQYPEGADLVSALLLKADKDKVVDLTSDQTISGNKTIAYGNRTNYTIKNGNLFGIGGNQYNYLQIDYNGVGMYSFGTQQFFPNSNNSRDLGTNILMWRNLYLSGNLTDGTNSIKVEEIAKKSDLPTDYVDLSSDQEIEGTKSFVQRPLLPLDEVSPASTTINYCSLQMAPQEKNGISIYQEGLKLYLNGQATGYWTFDNLLSKTIPAGNIVFLVFEYEGESADFGIRLRNGSTLSHAGSQNYIKITAVDTIDRVQLYGSPNQDYSGIVVNKIEVYDLTEIYGGNENVPTSFSINTLNNITLNNRQAVSVNDLRNYIKLTSDQIINGVKTFNERPLIKVLGTKLPEEYQEVEYIESTGTQYIDTGFIPTSYENVIAEIQYLYTSIPGDPSPYAYVLGARGSAIDRFDLVGMDRATQYTRIGTVRSAPTGISVEAYVEYTQTVDVKAHTLIINGVTYAMTYESPTTVQFPLRLFSTSQNDGSGSQWNMFGRIWYCRLYDNGILVRNLIPCYRKSDNVIGMYDTVSGSFYINQGTGEFLKGNDVLTSSEEKYVSVATIEDLQNLEYATDEDITALFSE